MKRNIIVTMKASPHPMAAILSRVLPIRSLLEYFGDALRSSEVIKSIIAVTASQRFMSEIVRGMFISTTVVY
jgi:hypothetical protein